VVLLLSISGPSLTIHPDFVTVFLCISLVIFDYIFVLSSECKLLESACILCVFLSFFSAFKPKCLSVYTEQVRNVFVYPNIPYICWLINF
jgi:hypothetical protein